MLRKTMIVLAMAAALTGGLTADALARGGGGGGHGGGFGGGAHMGGFGGAHMGGGFGRGHFGGGRAFGRGFAGQHFAKASGRFGHDRHFGRGRRFAPGWGAPYGYYGDSVGYYGDGGYYDLSTVAPDEQLTYPAPVVPSPPAPDAKVVSNPYSRVPSAEPDLLRPGELLVRFPPPKKISHERHS